MSEKLTAAQIRKLESIIGRLEALQITVKGRGLAYRLGEGKSALLTALREGSR